MSEITFRDANRRFKRLYWPLIAIYVVLCVGGAFLVGAMGNQSEPLLRAGVAALTAAPIAGVFWVMGRFLRETDEYTRKIQTEAMLTGGAITLSLAFLWALIVLYRVFPGLGRFPAMMMVTPAFFVFYGLSAFARRLMHGEDAGACG
jgi:hypothetical protein